jgi:hypothetical protein
MVLRVRGLKYLVLELDDENQITTIAKGGKDFFFLVFLNC